MGSRRIAKEKAAAGIRAYPDTRVRALGKDFRSRPGHRRKQPLEAALSGYEFQLPRPLFLNQFVMPFRYAENFVDRLDPVAGDSLFPNHRAKGFTQSIPKAGRTRK